jgi:hypothetical protein
MRFQFLFAINERHWKRSKGNRYAPNFLLLQASADQVAMEQAGIFVHNSTGAWR